MKAKQRQSFQIAPLFAFAVLWGVGLFGVLEIDVWTAKIVILSAIAPLSIGLDKFFYGF
jgi:hypothetical protein